MKKTVKNTGIEFKTEKVTVLAPRTKVHGLSFCILFLFFMAGLYGTFYSFSSAFPIEFNENVMFWGIFLIGFFLWILYFSGRYGRILLMPAVILTSVIWIYKYAEALKNQAVVVINTIREAVNQYFVMDLSASDTNPAFDSSVTELMLLAMLFIGLVLLLGLVIAKSRVLVLTATILPLAGAMMVGLMPSFWPLTLLAFCYIGSFSLRGDGFSHHKKKMRLPDYYQKAVNGYSALVMGAAAAAIFGISCLLLQPRMNEITEKAMEARIFVQQNSLIEMARSYFPKLRLSLSGAGQIDSGELGGNIDFTGEEALRATLYKMPGETIYLKGFSGSEYTGRRWIKDDDMDFFQSQYDGDPEKAKREFFEKPYELAAQINSYMGQDLRQMVVLENKGASNENVFAPYISKQDGFDSGPEYAFSYFERGVFADLLLMEGGGNLEQTSPLSDAYRDYVYGKYLSYPQESLVRLQQLYDENPLVRLDDIIEFIVSTVSGGASYTLQPGTCPSDRDFAEYFLFENKQGYCVHFATTAVLLFRMYGVPARYATGYIAQGQDFKETPTGKYEARIKDEKAHAWAEIYIDGEGWIPVEATPGYSRGSSPQHVTEPETKAAQNPVNPPERKVTGNQGGTGDAWGFLSGSMSGRIALLALFAVLAAAVLSLALAIRRMLMLKRRKKDGIRRTFQAMYEVLVLAGLPKRLDGTEENFAREAVKVLPEIDLKGFTAVMELVMQANYGSGQMNEQDTQLVREMYQKICELAYGRLSGIEKIEFKYFKVFA